MDAVHSFKNSDSLEIESLTLKQKLYLLFLWEMKDMWSDSDEAKATKTWKNNLPRTQVGLIGAQTKRS